MRKKITLFLCSLVFCLNSTANATDNQYIVDVIILKHNNIEEYPKNLFFNDKTRADESQLINFDITECSSANILGDADNSVNESEYQCDQEYVLVNDGYKPLEKEKQNIEKSPKFSVLKHITWQQPGYDKKNSKGIYGKASSEDTKELLEEGIEVSTIPWIKKTEN